MKREKLRNFPGAALLDPPPWGDLQLCGDGTSCRRKNLPHSHFHKSGTMQVSLINMIAKDIDEEKNAVIDKHT